MQILLQKVSSRSKTIRKREKIVNESLKRQRIHLYKKNFDLMDFLQNSLDAAADTKMTPTEETKKPTVVNEAQKNAKNSSDT